MYKINIQAKPKSLRPPHFLCICWTVNSKIHACSRRFCCMNLWKFCNESVFCRREIGGGLSECLLLQQQRSRHGVMYVSDAWIQKTARRSALRVLSPRMTVAAAGDWRRWFTRYTSNFFQLLNHPFSCSVASHDSRTRNRWRRTSVTCVWSALRYIERCRVWSVPVCITQ